MALKDLGSKSARTDRKELGFINFGYQGKKNICLQQEYAARENVKVLGFSKLKYQDKMTQNNLAQYV
jgi:hypothetical protein